MAELGKRLDVGGVLVHDPGVAAGWLHHMHGLEESGDVGRTIQAVWSVRHGALTIALASVSAFLKAATSLLIAFLHDIGIGLCGRRREVRGIGRHDEDRKERRLAIGQDFQLSSGISPRWRTWLPRNLRQIFATCRRSRASTSAGWPAQSRCSAYNLRPHPTRATQHTWFAESSRIGFLGGLFQVRPPRRREGRTGPRSDRSRPVCS